MKHEDARYSPLPWRQLVAVRALCSDGKTRWARVGIPDTHFSAPARVSVGGKTVSGYVDTTGERPRFHVGEGGKNANLLPCEHTDKLYNWATWKATKAKNTALIYCGPRDVYRCRGIRTAETEGQSMIEHVRPHALKHLAWSNVVTLARITANRYGMFLPSL